MNQKRNSRIFELLHQESGQVIPWVAVTMVVFLGITAFAVDLGHAMVCYRELQASTNAAAMAAVQSLPGTGYATVGPQYGSASGGANVNANLPNVTTRVAAYCSSSLGLSCLSPSGANAVVVTQTTAIPTMFARILGVSTINLSATATAAMKGSPRAPFNVAIIVDTTQSMTSSDNGVNCSGTRISCALQGIRILLGNFSPCYTGLSSCSGQTAVDEVALFAFPGPSNAAYDYTCPHSGSNGANPYPDTKTATSSTLISNYQILPLANDYRFSDGTTTLNSGSSLVIAAGAPDAQNQTCGMAAKGGEGTYYAGAINAAQQYLAENSRTGADNVMILLSDGDASGSTTVNGQSNSVKFATSNPSTDLYTNGTYPSNKDLCAQGLAEATAAKNAGTTIYVVAYGAANSSSGYCKTDSPAQNPCTVLQNMSSNALQYFFADTSSGSNGCQPPAGGRTTTSLNSIFTQIAGDLTVARMVPTKPGCTATNTSACI